MEPQVGKIGKSKKLKNEGKKKALGIQKTAKELLEGQISLFS